MSVIAYYKGEVGCDTMGYCETTGIWLPQRKLFGWQDCLWGAFCGKEPPLQTANDCLEIMKGIIGFMEHRGITRYTIDDTIDDRAQAIFTGLVTISKHHAFFASKKQCYYVSEDVRIEAIDERVPAFSGSSGVVAATALLHGLKMKQAIELALHIGPLSRGHAIVESTRKLKAIKNTRVANAVWYDYQQRSNG